MTTKPTRADLLTSASKTVPDVIASDLKILFCGINPGLYSGYTGYHFARPGNRFWPTLHNAGFTPRLLKPEEQAELLPLGYGITNLVTRATATADELTARELAEGGLILADKVARYNPLCVAILGIGAYRDAFGKRGVILGEQPEGLAGAQLWVLPNPSGLNAHYSLDELAREFGRLRAALLQEEE